MKISILKAKLVKNARNAKIKIVMMNARNAKNVL